MKSIPQGAKPISFTKWCIRSSPPKDLNTYENAVAPTNIPKIIAPVNADLSVTSFKTLKFNRLFKTASKIEPKAPTPAASVGVAKPANIEPRTKKIKKIGGKKDLKINCIFSLKLYGASLDL